MKKSYKNRMNAGRQRSSISRYYSTSMFIVNIKIFKIKAI